jgi:hypothetical protein
MDNISDIKQKFIEITATREAVILIMDNIKLKIEELKKIHEKLTNRAMLYNLGLDALNFQRKLFDSDYECIDTKFKFINNRVYCDYYKFYKIVIKYITENITDFKVLNCYNRQEYPWYNDLEKYKEYDFTNVKDIHYNICKIINELNGMLQFKGQELKEDETKTKQGLNIHNYVNDTRHLNNIIDEEVKLFLNYLKVFNNYHKKYFDNFSLKAKLLYGQIKTDINFDLELTRCDSESSIELDTKEEEKMRSLIGCRQSESDGGKGIGLPLLEKVFSKLRSPSKKHILIPIKKENYVNDLDYESYSPLPEEYYDSESESDFDPELNFHLNGKCLIRKVIRK